MKWLTPNYEFEEATKLPVPNEIITKHMNNGASRDLAIALARFIDALGDMRRTEARHAFHFAEDVIEDVSPVAQHIEDDAATLLRLVVPRRALRGLPIAFEYPVAELTAHRQDAAEESRVA